MTYDRQAIPIDRTHGGNHHAGLIDFSVSINPLGPPLAAIDEYHAAAARITSYPAPYAADFERQVAAAIGVEPANVIAGNGSTQLIHLIFRALRFGHPAVVIPTFSEIANAAAVYASPARGLLLPEAEGFALAPALIERALDHGADAIFIGRPNSPTATLISQSTARAIAQACADRRAWCVFDEAFIDFTGEASMARLAADQPGIVVIRSMTKIFAMPGLRLGFAVATPETILRMRNALEPWSVSVAAEQVGLACLGISGTYLAETLRIVARERDFLYHRLNDHRELHVFPSAANFLMLAAGNERRPGDFGAFLNTQGTAIRDLASLPGSRPGLYRIGVRLRRDNERLAEATHLWHP